MKNTNLKTLINTDDCQCPNSSFLDPYHKHIMKGNLRIVESSKVTKLLGEGPNYREPRSINFNECLQAITSALMNVLTLFHVFLFVKSIMFHISSFFFLFFFSICFRCPISYERAQNTRLHR